MGIKGSVRVEARRAMSVEAFDPITGDRLLGQDLAAGQSLVLSGRTAMVLRGHYR